MKNSLYFAEKQTVDLRRRVDAGESVSVVGIPGSGITIFLRHFSNETAGESLYIDVASLPEPSENEFYNSLLHLLDGTVILSASTTDVIARLKQHIQKRLSERNRVIIIIAGFDHLQPAFSSEFFRCLQVLHTIDPARIVFVFGSCRKLDSILPQDLIDTNIRLFASTYYLPPYGESDMRCLLSQFGIQPPLERSALSALIKRSGGHFQLLQLLIHSEYRHNPIDDTYIQLVFKNILSHLSTSQQNAVKKLVINAKYETKDTFLINVGIVRLKSGAYVLFSDLFTEYIRKYYSLKLPAKERRLLAILKKKEGRVVTKHEIYDAVWRGSEVGSEWALNALIYRLRRHPAFRAQPYVIENYKKIGYSLTKI